MSDPPPRLKPMSEWTPADHFHSKRTGEEIVNPAYTEARSEALRRAGFDEPDDPADKPLDEMTPDDYFKRIRSNR